MNIGGNHAVSVNFHSGMPRNFDVLADLGDHGDAVGLDVSTAAVSRKFFCHVIGKSAEHFVSAHEVGFAIHFDKHPSASLWSDILGDNTFTRLASALGAGGSHPLLSEYVHGSLEVATGFGQSLFAVHHAGVGHFAKFRNGSSSNLSHKSIDSLKSG